MEKLIAEFKKEINIANKDNAKNAILSKINQHVKQNTNIELEIRFQNISKIIFATLYENSKIDEFTISKTINFINSNNKETSLIKEIDFTNEEKKEKIYKKERIISIPQENKFLDQHYTVNVSSEINNINDNFAISANTKIRAKIRKSSFLDVQNLRWRFDFTVVYQCYGKDLKELKPIKDELFLKDIKYFIENNTFMTKEINNNIKYEFEVELMNSTTIPTSQDINNITEIIFSYINPKYKEINKLETELKVVCEYICKKDVRFNNITIKKLLPKVVSLTKNEYKSIFPPLGFYVTDKADGKRGIMIIKDDKYKIITDNVNEYASGSKNHDVYIFDGEFIEDLNIFYAFDIMVNANITVTHLKFSERLALLNKCEFKFAKEFVIKPYTLLNDEKNLEEQITKNRVDFYKNDTKFDGYIFVEDGNDYFATRMYKYKNIAHNTIDFLVKKVPEELLANQEKLIMDGKYKKIHDRDLYLLFVGINHNTFNISGIRYCIGYEKLFETSRFENYFPIQFSSCSMPYAYMYYRDSSIKTDIDCKIVEMICIKNCGAQSSEILPEWQEVGIRIDRENDLLSNTYFGNDYQVAELTWINYIDPFNVDELWGGINHSYFNVEKLSIYSSQIAYVSFIKSQLILNNLTNKKTIIDVAAGKGQDLGRYYNANISDLYALDIDSSALAELMQRRYSNKIHDIKTAIHVMIADMNENYTINVEKLNSHFELYQTDAIVCNLAIHYFLDTIDKMQNFIMFCKSMIRKSGVIIITCFFGEEIFKLLKDIEKNETYNIYQDDVLKYSLKKLYSGNFADCGQKIGVKLPFSGNEYYEENLVNTTYFINCMEEVGFKLKSKKSMIEYLKEFKSRKNTQILSEDDEKYISLYGEMIFTYL